jgi:hypothetical protein
MLDQDRGNHQGGMAKHLQQHSFLSLERTGFSAPLPEAPSSKK